MHPITTFSLAKHDGPYEDWPSRTPLLADGLPTGVAIAGYVIDGQYRCQDGILLIVSWDCPFEESYQFRLMAADHRTLATKSLGVPHGKYLLEAHWPVDDRTLHLRFCDDVHCRLTIDPPGRWRRQPRLRLAYDVEPAARP
jgi:hypothetical protein